MLERVKIKVVCFLEEASDVTLSELPDDYPIKPLLLIKRAELRF